MKRLHLAAAIVLASGLGLSACGGDTSDSGAASSQPSAPAQEAAKESMPEPEAAMPMPEPAETTGGTTAAAAPDADGDGDPCTILVTVGDSIAYSAAALSVPSSCASVTVTLNHTGNLPKAAMGHNWVLLPADALDEVGNAGMAAGLEKNYVPDDERIVAATDLVGGGESSAVTFETSALDAGTSYMYVCTFPGHWTIMKGTFTVEG